MQKKIDLPLFDTVYHSLYTSIRIALQVVPTNDQWYLMIHMVWITPKSEFQPITSGH